MFTSLFVYIIVTVIFVYIYGFRKPWYTMKKWLTALYAVLFLDAGFLLVFLFIANGYTGYELAVGVVGSILFTCFPMMILWDTREV